MKKLFYYLEIVLVLMLFWIILNEQISLANVLIGSVLGLIAVIFTDHYLLVGDYKYYYKLRMSLIIKYLIYLVYEIYISGFKVIGRIISGKTNVAVFEIETHLKDDYLVCLLANFITLTPGTVTLDKNGSRLKILCLDCNENKRAAIEKDIKRKIDKILSRR